MLNRRKKLKWVKDKYDFFLNSHWYLWNRTLSNKMNDHKYEGLKRNKSFNSGVDSSTCTRSRPKYFNCMWRFIAKFKTITAAAIAHSPTAPVRSWRRVLANYFVHLNRKGNYSQHFLSVFDQKTKNKPQTCH